jgi:hypothetical protein
VAKQESQLKLIEQYESLIASERRAIALSLENIANYSEKIRDAADTLRSQFGDRL